MLGVKVKFRDLRVGDVFAANFTDDEPETMETMPSYDGSDIIYWETNKHRGENRWCGTPSLFDQDVTLYASTQDIADRVVEALGRFDAEVRQQVAKRLCLRCGGIDCRTHL